MIDTLTFPGSNVMVPPTSSPLSDAEQIFRKPWDEECVVQHYVNESAGIFITDADLGGPDFGSSNDDTIGHADKGVAGTHVVH